jgi:hypothetical protein
MGERFLPAHRFILAMLVLVIVAVGLAYLVSGILALLISAVVCVAIWLLRPIVMPAHHGVTKVHLLSVLCFFGLISSFGFWSGFANEVVKRLARDPSILENAPWLKQIEIGNEPSFVVVAAGLIALLAVLHVTRDRSIQGKHPDQLDIDFPDLSFENKLAAFCSALDQDLITTDREANWSPEYYTDLEAEVEIQNAVGSSQRRRIADLQHAIRSDRTTQAFLILGDPGSGKSVALRKLARDMLKEVKTVGRVPIYINLREWMAEGGRCNPAWSEHNPPTPHDLEDFVVRRLKSAGDVFMSDFVDAYFRKLWERGRLFFLFDSFDEIPELLDSNEESWLIDTLSSVTSRFIASNPRSRGILASRMFRRPTHAFLAGKVLEIRPMTEEKIVLALARHPEFTNDIKVSLFRDRPDLVPIARNPLLASLLGEWVKARRSLPQNQADLYRDYLSNRLEKCNDKIRKADLNVEEVLNITREIAWFIFESPVYGLEAPVNVISSQSVSPDTDAVIEILRYARIARVTTTEPRSFAFSHRRFLEYFVTSKLLEIPERLPLDHIPTDSRGRDALVLYGQVCDDASAKQLAELCWQEIKTNIDSPALRLRATHSLRFLIDAFRSRREAISSFSDEFSEFIHSRVENGDSLIQAKICLEATGLMSDNQALSLIKSALQSQNTWLQETAFRACRQLPRIDPDLKKQIVEHIVEIPIFYLFKNRRHLDFTLSLSDGLVSARKAARLRTKNLFVSIAAIFTSTLIAPSAVIVSLMFTSANFLLDEVFGGFNDQSKDGSKKSRWLYEKFPRYEKIFRGFRVCVFVILAVYGLGIALGEKDDLFGNPVTFGFLFMLTDSNWIAAIIVLCLSAATLDIASISFFTKNLASGLSVLEAVKFFASFFASVVFAIVVVLGGLYLLSLIIGDFIKEIAVIPGIVFLLLFLFSTILAVHFEIRERFVFSKITFPPSMSRTNIATILSTLKSNRKRLAFVRKLEQERVVAMGEWPTGFSFSITTDPALTELAKLEEHWLGLDR